MGLLTTPWYAAVHTDSPHWGGSFRTLRSQCGVPTRRSLDNSSTPQHSLSWPTCEWWRHLTLAPTGSTKGMIRCNHFPMPGFWALLLSIFSHSHNTLGTSYHYWIAGEMEDQKAGVGCPRSHNRQVSDLDSRGWIQTQKSGPRAGDNSVTMVRGALSLGLVASED